jgi:uncharacterized repeat protein (TIGR02543 family)
MLVLTLAIAGCGGSGMVTKYSVTFNSNGGSTVSAQEVSSGGLVTRPADPTKSGYTFGGWYKEVGLTTAWNFASDTVTSNITLYAKWNSSGGRLYGYIYYFANYQEIDARHVLVTIGGNSTYTDDLGYYSISNIAAGTYTVKADFSSVTNTPPAPYTIPVFAGSSYFFNSLWHSAWDYDIGELYNDIIIGTEENTISISNGTNYALNFRLAVQQP